MIRRDDKKIPLDIQIWLEKSGKYKIKKEKEKMILISL